MGSNTILVVGGSGFVGRHVINRLVSQAYRVLVPTRKRDRARHLFLLPTVDVIQCDVGDPTVLARLAIGTEAVINLTGILNETRHETFDRVHVELTQKIVTACHGAGVRRLLHMSALHAATMAPSAYLRTKAQGEAAVREVNDVAVTVFRPSVIFGARDSFTNRFARLLRFAPGVLPLACPQARFQPVHVEDVARAFALALDEHRTFGQAYDLCGPRVYTLHELVTYIARLRRRRTRVVGLSDFFSRMQATLLEFVPGKPFSRDNYYSLQVDNVCDGGGALAPVFGIAPTPLEEVAPSYLGEG